MLDAPVNVVSEILISDFVLFQSLIVSLLYALTVYVYVVPLAAVVSV